MNGILIFSLFLLLSFIFSSSEMSFIASDKLYVKIRAKNSRYFMALHSILLTPKIYLYTTLVGNNIANVVLTIVAESMFLKSASIANALVLSFAVSAIVLLFGEITPKAIASIIPEKMALIYTPFIRIIYIILYPIIFISSFAAEAVMKIFNREIYSDEKSHLSAIDVEHLILSNIDIASSAEYESKMLHGIFEFSDKNASDVMIPRKEVVFIESNESVEAVKNRIRSQKKIFTRYPLYEKFEENIIGIININDIVTNSQKNLKQLIKKVLFVPETLTLDMVLLEMRKNSNHMAVVIDEYGGVAGILTFENIIEELIGDISDEYDFEESIKEIEGKIIISGDEKVKDINEKYNLKLPLSEEYETLSGLIMKKLGRIPIENDIATFKNSCKIRVVKVKNFAVKQIDIERMNVNEK